MIINRWSANVQTFYSLLQALRSSCYTLTFPQHNSAHPLLLYMCCMHDLEMPQILLSWARVSKKTPHVRETAAERGLRSMKWECDESLGSGSRPVEKEWGNRQVWQSVSSRLKSSLASYKCELNLSVRLRIHLASIHDRNLLANALVVSPPR